MPSEYRLTRRVLFHETDMAGIVHFSTFFRYMEEAEHALWRAAGLSIAPRKRTVGFPRVAAAFEYRQPLRFEDEVEICVRVAAVTNRTIRYTCTMTRGGERVADGTMTIVAVAEQADGSIVAVPLPAEIAAAFQVHPDAAS
jgi:YbgC/YbaW family acyl-CoA thioester hydrolase